MKWLLDFAPRASCWLLLFLSSPAWAQLPYPSLNSVYPPGGKRGGNVEVTVAGANLDDAEKLVFSHPGITAQPKTSPADEFLPQPTKVPNQFVVTIAADVPPGFYEVRHVGRYGATNPRTFVVGVANEVLDSGANTAKDKAQELSEATIAVNGRADANNLDYYALNLKAGQQLLIECQARRIDSKLSASLILIGPDGRELLRAQSAVGQDSVLDFKAAQDGRYLLAVHDFVFNGGPDYFYRLQVSGQPYIDFILPAAGLPGSNEKYTIYGRNLPGGTPAEGVRLGGTTLQKLEVNISIPNTPAGETAAPVLDAALLRSVGVDSTPYRITSPQGDSNTVAVGVAAAPVVKEQESNNAPAQSQKISLPCEVAGQFYPQRDEDWFQFEGKKGEVWNFDLISHRLGMTADPAMLIQRVTKNDKGEEQVNEVAFVDDPQDRAQRIGNEFDTSTDDPSYKLTVPEDGVYRVMLRDQFGDSRSDPRFVYRLAITKPEPDFRLTVFPDIPSAAKQQNQLVTDTLVVPKGGAGMLVVNVERRHDFEGEINISLEGLPGGITCGGALLAGKTESTLLVISAADSAAAWSGPIRVVGKSTINGQPRTRIAACGTMVWGTQNKQNEPPRSRAMRDLLLSVTDKEPSPVSLKVGDGAVVEMALGGKVELPLQLTRRGELKDPLKITGLGLPKDLKAKDLTLDNSKNDGKLELDLNVATLKPGTYTFCLKADSKRNYARNPELVTSTEADLKRLVDLLPGITEKQKQLTATRDQQMKDVAQGKTTVQQAEQKLNGLKPDDAARKDTEQQLNDAKTKLAALETALAASEQAVKEIGEKVKAGNQRKQEMEKRLADVKKDAQPKDVTVSFLSTEIKLRLVAAPIKLESIAAAAPVKAGEKLELPVTISRQFGFKDAVELSVEPPANTPGFANAKGTVAADQTQGKAELAPQKNTPPGDYTCTVKAKGKFGNVPFEVSLPATIKVVAP